MSVGETGCDAAGGVGSGIVTAGLRWHGRNDGRPSELG